MKVKNAFQKDSNPKQLTVSFIMKGISFTRDKSHKSQMCSSSTVGQGIANFHELLKQNYFGSH